MRESTLVKVALSCSLVGIVSLFVISMNIALPKLGEVDEGVVELAGTVSRVFPGETVTKIILEEGGNEHAIVAFNSPNIAIEEGMEVTVEAEISDYQGKQELIAYRIRSD
ncbi:MAG: hypothetical protein KJ709_09295 [Nanoarchaeota archaeon]|nr:hypothetical protein [Nanoarchaeota archaeon]